MHCCLWREPLNFGLDKEVCLSSSPFPPPQFAQDGDSRRQSGRPQVMHNIWGRLYLSCTVCVHGFIVSFYNTFTLSQGYNIWAWVFLHCVTFKFFCTDRRPFKKHGSHDVPYNVSNTTSIGIENTGHAWQVDVPTGLQETWTNRCMISVIINFRMCLWSTPDFPRPEYGKFISP